MNHQKARKVSLEVKIPETDENHRLEMDFDEQFYSKTYERDVKNVIDRLLSDVKFEKPFCLHEAIESYSYENQSDLPEYKKNTAIEVTIPYCLDVPQSFSTEVNIADKKINALVKFIKVWTEKCNDSSIADFYAEDKVTYF